MYGDYDVIVVMVICMVIIVCDIYENYLRSALVI